MKTVIEMAREAGFVVCRDESVLREMLERFAELVRADERKACAALCDQLADLFRDSRFATAIRARGET